MLAKGRNAKKWSFRDTLGLFFREGVRYLQRRLLR